MINSVEQAKEVFEKLARLGVKNNASDIFINTESYAAIKIDGKIKYLEKLYFDKEAVYHLLKALARPESVKEFEEKNELNFMYEITNLTYFRINVYMQRSMPGMVMRFIPAQIPDFSQLNLPFVLEDLAMTRRGLIILCGATGNGKSTTLAAMIDYRNQMSNNHIITVEDPIEFVHANKNSLVIQREVGVDTESYDTALKNSLRQAPDVILIGEIRNSDTMQYALHFADTGHLCLATMHATNSVQALERLFNFFQRDQRKQLQSELSSNLRALITQRLVERADGQGRTVSLEMMSSTPYIRYLIHEGDLEKIPEALTRGNEEEGVFSFDRYLFELYESGTITYEEAKNHIESENDFRVMLRERSKRPLPEELKMTGRPIRVQDEGMLERELMKKERDERINERERVKKLRGKGAM